MPRRPRKAPKSCLINSLSGKRSVGLTSLARGRCSAPRPRYDNRRLFCCLCLKVPTASVDQRRKLPLLPTCRILIYTILHGLSSLRRHPNNRIDPFGHGSCMQDAFRAQQTTTRIALTISSCSLAPTLWSHTWSSLVWTTSHTTSQALHGSLPVGPCQRLKVQLFCPPEVCLCM